MSGFVACSWPASLQPTGFCLTLPDHTNNRPANCQIGFSLRTSPVTYSIYSYTSNQKLDLEHAAMHSYGEAARKQPAAPVISNRGKLQTARHKRPTTSCPYCNQDFKSQRKFEEHILDYHRITKKTDRQHGKQRRRHPPRAPLARF